MSFSHPKTQKWTLEPSEAFLVLFTASLSEAEIEIGVNFDKGKFIRKFCSETENEILPFFINCVYKISTEKHTEITSMYFSIRYNTNSTFKQYYNVNLHLCRNWETLSKRFELLAVFIQEGLGESRTILEDAVKCICELDEQRRVDGNIVKINN